MKKQIRSDTDITRLESTNRPRSQAERSEKTRRAVCEATLDLLIELGSDTISTTIVAKHANISRGALTHQFPTRNDMFASSFDYLIDYWRNGFPFNTGPDYVKRRIDEFVQDLWDQIYARRSYAAAMALMMASSKDTTLGARLNTKLDAWLKERDNAAMLILDIEPDDARAIDFFELILASLRGIALYRFFSGELKNSQRQVDILKSMALHMMETSIRLNDEPGVTKKALDF